MSVLRLFVLISGLTALWQALVMVTHVPHYILPGSLPVLKALFVNRLVLAFHLKTTLVEMTAGLFLGTVLGSMCALTLFLSKGLRRWVLPLIVISQAVPVFALAPVLVLWLGYGMASKIAMAVLIIFFPVTASFYDGMRRTTPEYLELARIMDAGRFSALRYIIVPFALPAFASGLRVAAAVSPIGAVVGEWVGSSSGLGFYMLHANARMQIDIMFAALALLSCVSLTLYFSIDYILDKVIYWENKKDLS